MDDERFMRMAIDAAKKCESEDARTHPKVGVVVVRDGIVLTTANRGELKAGEHAEYTALEGKLHRDTLVGATVYTTLEPCTSRLHPKIACVERLIERKVARVCIRMLDPNPAISGKGQQRLRDANIITDLFPEKFMAEVEELNREFVRQHRQSALRSNSTGLSLEGMTFAQSTVHVDRASGLLRFQVPAGDYVEIHHQGLVVNVSIEEIVEREFSAFGGPRLGHGCHMKVNNGGGLLFCGNACAKIGINEFIVPTKGFDLNDLEEPVSVYFFWAHRGLYRFFRLFVEHINRKTRVVTLDAFFCRGQMEPSDGAIRVTS